MSVPKRSSDALIAKKLDDLRSNYETLCGRSFSHFFCPILFRDEDVEICKAHIVNRAFRNTIRRWTVQRKDVDGFFGRFFEADFVSLQYADTSPDKIIADIGLRRELRPKILSDGESVDFYPTNGPVPKRYTEAVLESPDRQVRLCLKIEPNEAASAMTNDLQIVVEKDARLAALVSLLKAAHLTLFEMLGYEYALSAGGHFLGKTILGDFYLQNRDLAKAEVLRNAKDHFDEFKNMLRPIVVPSATDQETLSSGLVFICEAAVRWAFMVFIRTADRLHAVLVPILDEPRAAAQFVRFLRAGDAQIQARRCQFKDGIFSANSALDVFNWPEVSLE